MTVPTDERSGAAVGAVPPDVVRRAQQGDVDAFEAIYRAHAPAVLALARRMLGGDGEGAREAVQDVFVRAWERLPSFRGESAIATWLHRLAVNVVLDRLRRGARDAGRLVEAGDDAEDPLDRAADPRDGARPDDRLDARMDIDAAAARLPAGARTVWVLHDVMGYTHDEIAAMTGIATGTARAQLWRARRTLMRLLER